MTDYRNARIDFVCLRDVPAAEYLEHMCNPRVAKHMPLLTFTWDDHRLAEFLAKKEEHWARDGLGHWAILCNGSYAGWGGFEKEGEEWDFGLVLKSEFFGLGLSITRKALAMARADERIPAVSFLLPRSRVHQSALKRLGARYVGEATHGDALFIKYWLDTSA